MYRIKASLLAIVMLGLGCTDSPVEPSAPTAANMLEELDFFMPRLTADDFAHGTRPQTPRPKSGQGPARIEDDENTSRPIQQIFNPHTGVGFGSGHAWAMGRHDYIGNVGSVSTTAHVAFEDQPLGDQDAHRQDYTPFLLDWGISKFIWVQAKVFTDHTCGLSVFGSSDHRASWQFFQGTGVSAWGTARQTSQAAPVTQDGCASSSTSSGGGSDGSHGSLCYYFITYDTRTGEIVSADFLACTGVGDVRA